jgi:uncharacterized membrane protein
MKKIIYKLVIPSFFIMNPKIFHFSWINVVIRLYDYQGVLQLDMLPCDSR